MEIKNVLKHKNINAGYLYFYVHLVTELVCFYVLSSLVNSSIIIWMIMFIYDALAFIPQALIGYIKDKFCKINMGIIGVILLSMGFILFIKDIIYIGIILVALGNAFIHVEGANTTLRLSGGKLSHSAIFVSGGSFGVAVGKLLGKYYVKPIFLIILLLSIIPCIILADSYLDEKDNCLNYNYHNNKINGFSVILLATLVVIVRGYMAYGIPTTWNKTSVQMFLLFSMMGLGKALGGIISDMIGMRKTAIISVLVALPFLLIGDNVMIISLIGIALFSMTMSITLGLIVSVLKNKPCLAFGMTTIGLFMGTIPLFFIQFTNFWINSLIVVISSILCIGILNKIIIKESKYVDN